MFANSSTPSSSRSMTPRLSSVIDSPSSEPPSSVSVDEKSDDHQDHDDSGRIRDKASPQTEVMVNTALLAPIEFLKAENTRLQTQAATVDHF